jgi:trafficking protein particle complex subunit 6
MSLDAPLPGSDPAATYLNVSCLDLLLIEVVPLAERMARRTERIDRGEVDVDVKLRRAEAGGKGGKVEGDDGGGAVEDEEVYRDAIFFRLDGLGYRVGQGLSERCVSLITCPFGGAGGHWSFWVYLLLPMGLILSLSQEIKMGNARQTEEATLTFYFPVLQIHSRPSPVPRQFGCHQIPLQRPLDHPLQETDR